MSDGQVALIVMLSISVVFVLMGVLYVRRRALNVEDYIVSRNSAGPVLATATLVASVIGAWILFSPAETGTWAGMAGLIGYGVGQAAPLLAFIFLGPKMRRLMPDGHSLTEFVWYRYGRYVYVFTLGVIVFYMFVFLSAELTGIALAVNLLADTPLWLTALIVGILTVAYTAYGGIRASIFTDSVQFFFILPLLLVVFIVALVVLNGIGPAFSGVAEREPQLLSFTHGPGIEFGVTLIIAILAANMFHQGFWQRVYTCRDEGTLRRGFAMAGVLVIPMIFLAGLFGLMAVGLGAAGEPSVALFSVVKEIMPTWAVVIVLALALILVMSSMDTLLNGIASAVTSDLARFKPSMEGHFLLRSSRGITIALILPAIFIASQGYSVLYLFLIADLVCAAAVFPVFFGMYSSRFGGNAALISALVGLVVGTLFFPTPDFAAWNSIPLAGRPVVSFGSALGVSAVLSVAFAVVAGLTNAKARFDFSRLREQVRLIGG